MIAVNFSNIRENFNNYCDKINEYNETVIVTRKDNKNVVIMSENEYISLLKLKDEKFNELYAKMDKGLEEIKNGKGITKTFDELKKMEKQI
ncbi:MAG: type II toxin-antitoxin system Phd/YefM family antitoxin [Oscillospiraceae bacterium]|nr:type II toxin-antitoxin system Phd/YefM family antitoxin [Oscillospiraceae bacterium]